MEVLSFLSSSPSLLLFGSLKPKPSRLSLRQNDSSNPASIRKIIWNWKKRGSIRGADKYVELASLIHVLGRKRMPHVAEQLFLEMKSEGFQPNLATLSALMLCYADNGLLSQARSIWDEIINSSFVPNIELVAYLMDAYRMMGRFDEIMRLLNEVISRDFNMCPKIYSLAISCFGKGGQLELMEATMKEMVSSGYAVDSATGNAFIEYYSIFGSLTDMEIAYGRLKRSRILIEEDGIRAVASAYIRKKSFYKLGEFLRDVGLARRNVGNLIWNLLLLSYAGNFKMKTLQREFLRMLESGFSPDLTTFNIRALAFSKMSLFWDIHLSLEHMKHERVIPDLVTFGCILDAYLDKKLGRNLDFALNAMDVDDVPQVLTDPLVFEVFGKGDFHLTSEALLESNRWREYTYRELISIYVKKQYRSNQIFWNY